MRWLGVLWLFPNRFGDGVASGDAAKGETLADVAGALIEIAVDLSLIHISGRRGEAVGGE